MQFDNEIDQMRYELGVLSSGLNYGGFLEQVANKLSDLEYENARLRAALEQINQRDTYPPDGYGVWAEIARAALEVKP